MFVVLRVAYLKYQYGGQNTLSTSNFSSLLFLFVHYIGIQSSTHSIDRLRHVLFPRSCRQRDIPFTLVLCSVRYQPTIFRPECAGHQSSFWDTQRKYAWATTECSSTSVDRRRVGRQQQLLSLFLFLFMVSADIPPYFLYNNYDMSRQEFMGRQWSNLNVVKEFKRPEVSSFQDIRWTQNIWRVSISFLDGKKRKRWPCAIHSFWQIDI